MVRMLPRLAVAALMVTSMATISAPHALAQVQQASKALGAEAGFAPDAFSRSALFPTVPAVSTSDVAFPATAPDFSRVRRPALLPALYAANVALQALDAHSTMTALGRGAREANPLMTGVAGNRGALLAVKVGAAAGTIYFAEKLWRRNRVAAIALMVAVNGVNAAIVAHNYKVASRLR